MQATQEIVDMIDKMDGLTPSSAARSCRDIKLQDHDASDGMNIRQVKIDVYRRPLTANGKLLVRTICALKLKHK